MNFRSLWIAACSAALALMAAPGAVASLTYDLRVINGVDSKMAWVTADGAVVMMELWAVVKGTGPEAEGFQFGYGSILSSDGGNITGDLAATLTSVFGPQDSPAQHGKPQNLDGDGDLDVGSNGTGQDTDFFYARSADVETSGVPIANGMEFKLATVTFTVAHISDHENYIPIEINFRVTDFLLPSQSEGLWQEDGLPANPISTGSLPLVGTAVLIAVPEPSSGLLLGATLAGFAGFRRRRRSP